MAHHLVGDISLDWIENLSNCLLIRDPAEVLVSYLKKNSTATAEGLGYIQQRQLFDTLSASMDHHPPVLDARDLLLAPRRMLAALCKNLHVEFTPNMLSWEPGLRRTDGVWARHWYDTVSRSRGWQKYRPKSAAVPEEYMSVYHECKGYYDYLFSHRIKP